MDIQEVNVEGMDILTFTMTLRKCARFLNGVSEMIKAEKEGKESTIETGALIALSLIKFIEAEKSFRDVLMGQVIELRDATAIEVLANNKTSS